MAGSFLVQIKPDYVRVPVVGTEFTCQGKFYKRRAKNAANCASARSPIDFVPGEETVKVPHGFINGLKLYLIDFGG
jgi:hypothetical protein